MSSRESQAAWADFWKSKVRDAGSGCLPNGSTEIDAAQTAVWNGLARGLPKGARVLDLGTGDAVVLRKMLAVRSDLKATGVDSSPTLPPAPKSIAMRAATPVENLPFPPLSFDAITSQFGYEYCDTQLGCREVRRVLKRGGRFVFIMHRLDGPIVAHNLARRDALRWAISGSGYLHKARALVAARTVSTLPTPLSFSDAVSEARRLFPSQSVAPEFLTAVLQTLELGRNSPPERSLGVLAELEAKALNEISRIDSLQRAACDEQRALAIANELRSCGLDVANPAAVTQRSSGEAFARMLTGTRTA